MLTQLDKSHPRKTELHSRELLVVWIAYCVVFSHVHEKNGDDLPDMGVCLKYEDLRHLVLSSRRLWTIVHVVKCFLRDRYRVDREIFSLRCPEATFLMGETFAKQNLQGVYNQDIRDMKTRVANRWAEIEMKKRKLEVLRRELVSLEEQKVLAKRNADEADCSSFFYDSSAQLARCRRELQSITSRVERQKAEIARVRKAPPPIEQHLPRDSRKAQRWIFFLHMPAPLRSLANLSFTAQQMLLPRTNQFHSHSAVFGVDGPSVLRQLQTNMSNDSLVHYYNSRKADTRYCPTPNRCNGLDGVVLFRTASAIDNMRPKSHKDNVDNISDANNGVWYPDSVSPRMAWTGGPKNQSLGDFDPFRLDSTVSVSVFTEQLGKDDLPLQWALTLDGSRREMERGNRPLSTQNDRPEWLSKTEYLHFARLRAFPFVQLREVLSCVSDHESLPWENEKVHKIVFQSLFHIGNLTENDEECKSFLWKYDLYDDSYGGYLETCGAVLNRLADTLCQTPGKYQTLGLIGSLANFLSCWKSDLKAVARQLGDALCTWADDVEQEIQRLEATNTASHLKLKMCVFLRYALLCYGGGPLIDKDIEKIVSLTIRSKTMAVHDESDASEVSALESRCLEITCSLIHRIVDCVERRKDFITEQVNEVISGSPRHLRWNRMSYPDNRTTACYEASFEDCVFTVNLVTGILLVNGLPPASLPIEVVDNDLYRRVFGRRNFEVVPKAGAWETSRLVFGRKYQFFKNQKQLHVLETDPNSNEVFELLDYSAIGEWAAEMKPRLKQMHSHWLCRQKGAIFLRGRAFNDRSVSYVLLLTDSHNEVVEASVHPVPKHLLSQPTDQLLEQIQDFGAMVLSTGQKTQSAVSFLEKFEAPDFIHTLQYSNGALCFELPRFELSFELENNRLRCKELPGYSLCDCQVLLGTMHGFHRYLVVESCEDTRVIVPEGEVKRSRNGRTTVLLNNESSCDAFCQVHDYRVHPLLGKLDARNMVAQWRLAALHTATSIGIPDALYGSTGSEMALQLVRNSWTSRPRTKSEKVALENVMELSRANFPSVFLLCLDSLNCSQQVSFLYTGMDATTFSPEIHADLINSDDYISCLQRHHGRSMLSSQETLRIYGYKVDCSIRFHIDAERKAVGPCPVTGEEIRKLEESVKECFVRRTVATEESKRNFPLGTMETNNDLERDILDELSASWDGHIIGITDVEVRSDLTEILEKIQTRVETTSVQLKGYLSQSLEPICVQGSFFRLVNVHPSEVTNTDLIRAIYDPSWLSVVNPLLSQGAVTVLREAILLWLRVVVLSERIDRIRQLESSGRILELKQELIISRTWAPSDYPYWVAFEAEKGIQIRPEQAEVAIHLLRNPKHVVQLNMGMGKTSKSDFQRYMITGLLLIAFAFALDRSDLAYACSTLGFAIFCWMRRKHRHSNKCLVEPLCRSEGSFLVRADCQHREYQGLLPTILP